jgi:hypothetical protein
MTASNKPITPDELAHREKTVGQGHAHMMHDINTCAPLKSLVDALNNTGQVHVFSTSKGHWRRNWSPQPCILFRTNTLFARNLDSIINSPDARKQVNFRAWDLSAKFCDLDDPYEVICTLDCVEFTNASYSMLQSMWKFKLRRDEVDRDFTSLRELIEEAFPVLDHQKKSQQTHGDQK